MVQFCAGTGLFGQKKGFKVPGSVGHTTADYIGLGIPNVEMCDGPAGTRLEKRAVRYPNGDIKGVDLSISQKMCNFAKKRNRDLAGVRLAGEKFTS